jgi:hypothetical protein
LQTAIAIFATWLNFHFVSLGGASRRSRKFGQNQINDGSDVPFLRRLRRGLIFLNRIESRGFQFLALVFLLHLFLGAH